jgi:hypothetical protein
LKVPKPQVTCFLREKKCYQGSLKIMQNKTKDKVAIKFDREAVQISIGGGQY